MNTLPKISICITSYRRPKLLAETLEHLASIQDLDMEVVVCDDSSGNGAADVARQFAKHFENFKFHEQKSNQGGFYNVAATTRLASCPYLYVMSDDDMLCPEGILTALNFLDEHPDVVAAYGGWQEWDRENDTVLGTMIADEEKIFSLSDIYDLIVTNGCGAYPVVRTDIEHRFHHADSYNGSDVESQITYARFAGSCAILPVLFYKHAHTPGRVEHSLTENWYHDYYRGSVELSLASLDLDYAENPEMIDLVIKEVSRRSAGILLQGYVFAVKKKMFLRQRYFLLRAKAYNLVSQEQAVAWDSNCLIPAVAEQFQIMFDGRPTVKAIIVENSPLLVYFGKVFAEMFPDMPPFTFKNHEEFLGVEGKQQDDHFIAENFVTLVEREGLHGRAVGGTQDALMDWVNALRISSGDLNLIC